MPANPNARLLAALAVLAPSACLAQSFNIDLDIVSTAVGANAVGAPSSSFGAAASQPGFWNAVQNSTATNVTAPITLNNLAGSPTGVTINMSNNAPNGFAHWSYFPGANTGDFALLLNDCHVVNNSPLPNITNTYTFNGLQPGIYDVITYGVRPLPGQSSTRVDVAGAGIQNITGPMPGNAFALGVTHSWHTLTITGSSITVTVDRDPLNPSVGAYINGFQLHHTPVPTPGSGALLGAAGLLATRRRRRA